MSDADTGGLAGKPCRIGPELYDRDDVRRVLADHDFGVLYRMLKDDGGLSQRQIAQRTEQSQSEVSEILSGRRVENYRVLVRLSEGLGIPPGADGPVLVGSGWAPTVE